MEGVGSAQISSQTTPSEFCTPAVDEGGRYGGGKVKGRDRGREGGRARRK